MITVIAFLVSFLVTAVSIPLLRILAFKFEILDYPGGRKIHKEFTPLVGGMAVYIGMMASLFFNPTGTRVFFPVVLGSTLIVGLGLAEDIKKGIPAWLRLIIQTAAALVVISQGIRISFLPNTAWGNLCEILITLIWITGVTNAYNYLDGLDGLAAGSAVINLFFFGVILYAMGQYEYGFLALVFIGACLAFLPFNFRADKTFLGEAGSTLIGFLLACVAIAGRWANDHTVQLFIPIIILGVPIFDMIFTTIMRVKEGKVKTIIEWLRYGGRDHFHHYLVDIGLKPLGAVIFIYCITASLGISAVMVSNDNAIEGLLSLTQAGIIFSVIATLIVVGKRRRSGWKSV